MLEKAIVYQERRTSSAILSLGCPVLVTRAEIPGHKAARRSLLMPPNWDFRNDQKCRVKCPDVQKQSNKNNRKERGAHEGQ